MKMEFLVLPVINLSPTVVPSNWSSHSTSVICRGFHWATVMPEAGALPSSHRVVTQSNVVHTVVTRVCFTKSGFTHQIENVTVLHLSVLLLVRVSKLVLEITLVIDS